MGKWRKQLIKRTLSKDLWLIENGEDYYYAVTVGAPIIRGGEITSGNCLFKTVSIEEVMDYMAGECRV